MERDKETEILNILTQRTDQKLKVGDQEYDLYPISLGKLSLLTKHEQAVKNLLGLVSQKEDNIPDEETNKALEGAIEGCIEIFHILIVPNDGEPPKDLSDVEKKKLRWQLSTSNVMQIMMYLQTAHFPGDLLKNVSSPREEPEKPDGET